MTKAKVSLFMTYTIVDRPAKAGRSKQSVFLD